MSCAIGIDVGTTNVKAALVADDGTLLASAHRPLHTEKHGEVAEQDADAMWAQLSDAVRELTALGLGEQLARAGILTAELAFYNRHGQLIWTEPRGRAAGYRWPQISISRSKLQEVLLGAVSERLGSRALVTGHHLTGLEQRGDKVVARFTDPAGQPAGEAQGDLLIGADGIHSAVRRHFYPGEAAVFDGYLHYRGIVEGDADPQTFIPYLLDLHSQGKFPFDKLITTMPLAQINEAVEAQHRGEVLKAVLTP